MVNTFKLLLLDNQPLEHIKTVAVRLKREFDFGIVDTDCFQHAIIAGNADNFSLFIIVGCQGYQFVATRKLDIDTANQTACLPVEPTLVILVQEPGTYSLFTKFHVIFFKCYQNMSQHFFAV